MVDGSRPAAVGGGEAHEGELLGVPPTGRTVEVGLVDILRVEDGRFVEHWGGPDLFDLLRQLGASVVLPEGHR